MEHPKPSPLEIIKAFKLLYMWTDFSRHHRHQQKKNTFFFVSVYILFRSCSCDSGWIWRRFFLFKAKWCQQRNQKLDLYLAPMETQTARIVREIARNGRNKQVGMSCIAWIKQITYAQEYDNWICLILLLLSSVSYTCDLELNSKFNFLSSSLGLLLKSLTHGNFSDTASRTLKG